MSNVPIWPLSKTKRSTLRKKRKREKERERKREREREKERKEKERKGVESERVACALFS